MRKQRSHKRRERSCRGAVWLLLTRDGLPEKKSERIPKLIGNNPASSQKGNVSMLFSGTSQHFLEGGRIAKPLPSPPFQEMNPPQQKSAASKLLFQVRSAWQDLTDQAVRNALISALWGPASEFVECIGLTSPLDTIVKEMEERFVRNIPPDALVCKFYQLQQGWHEKIKEFSVRIEKLYKQLIYQLLDWYPDKALMKDCLFYGMYPYMRDSL